MIVHVCICMYLYVILLDIGTYCSVYSDPRKGESHSKGQQSSPCACICTCMLVRVAGIVMCYFLCEFDIGFVITRMMVGLCSRPV